MDIFSREYGDYYFSRENGLEETKYVFLGGNNLPQAWAGHSRFAIAETGFGTGMNFLCAWELFDKTAAPGQSLHYIGVEKHPLDRDLLKRFLRPIFGTRADEFLAEYPWPTPGYHRLQLSQNVTLTLIFDDVKDAFHLFDGEVDCWFLDGFVPSGNPDMWTDTLFAHMARLSLKGTSFATFTAAGFVRRGLAKAGFEVERVKGYGRKREMLAGRFSGGRDKTSHAAAGSVAIIGGGLAGAAAAYALACRGYHPTLYEQEDHLAAGASGNSVGLFNPRPFAMRHPRGEYHTAGMELIARTASQLSRSHDIDFRLGGCLHLTTGRKKEDRHEKAEIGMGWPGSLLHNVTAAEASMIAGIPIAFPCLYSPLGGAVSPPKLIQAYTADTHIQLNSNITSLKKCDQGWALIGQNGDMLDRAEIVITTRPVEIEGHNVPYQSMIRPVRGQITEMLADKPLSNLRCNIAHGGYLARARDRTMIMGATFQRGEHDDANRPEDDYRNYYQMREALPALKVLPRFTYRRAAVRLTTADHMPLVGRLADNVYISGGWGSHGLLGTILGGHMLADMLDGTPLPVPRHVRAALDPARFFHDNISD